VTVVIAHGGSRSAVIAPGRSRSIDAMAIPEAAVGGPVRDPRLRVAMIAAECEPWAKAGGLADVIDGLARGLGRMPGHAGVLETPLDVFLPRYRSMPVPADAEAEPALEIENPDLDHGGHLEVRIINVRANGYRLRLIDFPPAFDRDRIYDYRDDAWRFAVLARAALAALRRDGHPLDVLHVHDWHTGPVLLERARAEASGDSFLARTAVIATLHNLSYHGWTPADRLHQLGLQAGDRLAGPNPDGIDLLRIVVEGADLVNTVSPGYAREALTPEYGMGLDDALRALGDRFIGILNGLDPDVWNPEADGALAASYGPGAMRGKAACRRALLTELGFDARDEGLVVGSIGRLDPQKGFDLVAGAGPELLAAGVRLVALVDHPGELADALRSLSGSHPDRVSLIERFDRDLARRIYAGADAFLMPSRFEPCGLGQMIALRYGTPPIVRRTGGLADSVIDVDEKPGGGTGWQFDDATPEALAGAVRRAQALRSHAPASWSALQSRAMAVDLRWDTGAAPRYLEAYRRAVAIRRGGG
jgi:starch synthase